MAIGIHREGGSGMPHADMVVVDSQAGPQPVCPQCMMSPPHRVVSSYVNCAGAMMVLM